MQRISARLFAFACLMAGFAPTARAVDSTPGAEPADYSVLTPGLSARFLVSSGGMVEASAYYDIGRKYTLRDLADRDGYDARSRLQAQLIAFDCSSFTPRFPGG